MKHILLSTLAFCFSWSSYAEIQQHIEKVLLYPDTAKVQRVIKLNRDSIDDEGWFTLCLIPQNIDKNKIQAISNTSNISVKNLQFNQREENDLKDDLVILDLQKQIDAIKTEIQQIKEQKELATAKIEYAEQLRNSVSESYGKNPLANDAVNQAKQIWDYTEENIIAANEAINECNKKIKPIYKKLEPLKKEKEERLQKLKQLLGEVKIQLSDWSAQEIEIKLEYWVYNCRWFPRYELHANLDKKTIEFTYQAEITQNSGEDWNNVECILNTYSTNRNGMAPELPDLVLHPRANYAQARSMNSFAMDKAVAMESEAVPPPAQKMTSKRGLASFEITPSEHLNISNNKSQKLDLLTKEIDAKFWSEIIAPFELRAYLKSEIKNTFDIPILAGKAYTYADGNYLSEVYLKHTLPEEKLDLSLGVDDSVKVKRKALVRQEQNAGLIDKTTRHKRRYETKIINLHPVEHKFRIFDRIPKTENAKIEIIWNAPQKNQVIIEEGSQVFYWDVKIPSNSEKQLYTEFEVIQPREWNLNQEF